jgi:hypothetical protein
MQKFIKASRESQTHQPQPEKRRIGARQLVLTDYNAKLDSDRQDQVALESFPTKLTDYTNCGGNL